MDNLSTTLAEVKGPRPENPAVDLANVPANRRRVPGPIVSPVETPLAGTFAGHRSRWAQ